MAFPNCSHVSATDTSRPTGADYIYCLAKEVRKLKESIAAGIDSQGELLANVLTMIGNSYTPITSWTQALLPVSQARGIGAGKYYFVVAHQDLGDGKVSVGDLVTWTDADIGAGAYWRAVVESSDNTFVVIGTDHVGVGNFTSVSSSGGFEWSGIQTDLPSSQSWISIAANDLIDIVYVAIPSGSTNVFARQYSGVWSGGTFSLTANWADITYADGKFIAVSGNPGYVAVSTDEGASFTVSQATGSSLSLNCISHNGAVWCAVAANGAIITSPTGLAGSWTEQRAPDGKKTYSVAALDGVFYSPVYDSAECLYSVDDGVTWESFSFPITGLWIDIAANDYGICAISVGTNVAIYARILPYIYGVGAEFLSVKYTGAEFIVVENRETPLNQLIHVVKRDRATWHPFATVPIDSNFRKPGSTIEGVCFDGLSTMFLSYVLGDLNPAYLNNGWIAKIDLASFTATGFYRSANAFDAHEVTFVGGYLFTVSDGLLRKIDPATMTDVSTFADLPLFSQLLNDGTSVVYISATGNALKKINPATDVVTTVATVFETSISHIHNGYLYVNSSTTPGRLAKISLTTGAVTDINQNVLSFWHDTLQYQAQKEIYNNKVSAKIAFGTGYKAGIYDMLTDTTEYAPTVFTPEIKINKGFMITDDAVVQAGFDVTPIDVGVLSYTMHYFVESSLL